MQTNHLHQPWRIGNFEIALCGVRIVDKPSGDPNAHIAWFNPSVWPLNSGHRCPECLVLYALDVKDDA